MLSAIANGRRTIAEHTEQGISRKGVSKGTYVLSENVQEAQRIAGGIRRFFFLFSFLAESAGL